MSKQEDLNCGELEFMQETIDELLQNGCLTSLQKT